MLLNSMFIHNFIPENMLDTIIVPLIKDKNEDLQDVNNYRPLALTSILSKLLEFLILNMYSHLLKTTCNQFGFKKKSSTDLCILSLRETINYFKTNNTPIFICFLDASKAFDKLNHWHLFRKLLDRGMPPIIIRLLLYLYIRQSYSVKWGGCYSNRFFVTNGAPQGRICSPIFFNVYMNDLSLKLNKSNF